MKTDIDLTRRHIIVEGPPGSSTEFVVDRLFKVLLRRGILARSFGTSSYATDPVLRAMQEVAQRRELALKRYEGTIVLDGGVRGLRARAKALTLPALAHLADAEAEADRGDGIPRVYLHVDASDFRLDSRLGYDADDDDRALRAAYREAHDAESFSTDLRVDAVVDEMLHRVVLPMLGRAEVSA